MRNGSWGPPEWIARKARWSLHRIAQIMVTEGGVRRPSTKSKERGHDLSCPYGKRRERNLSEAGGGSAVKNGAWWAGVRRHVRGRRGGGGRFFVRGAAAEKA